MFKYDSGGNHNCARGVVVGLASFLLAACASPGTGESSSLVAKNDTIDVTVSCEDKGFKPPKILAIMATDPPSSASISCLSAGKIYKAYWLGTDDRSIPDPDGSLAIYDLKLNPEYKKPLKDPGLKYAIFRFTTKNGTPIIESHIANSTGVSVYAKDGISDLDDPQSIGGKVIKLNEIKVMLDEAA